MFPLLGFIQFHMIPANILMTEIHGLNLVPHRQVNDFHQCYPSLSPFQHPHECSGLPSWSLLRSFLKVSKSQEEISFFSQNILWPGLFWPVSILSIYFPFDLRSRYCSSTTISSTNSSIGEFIDGLKRTEVGSDNQDEDIHQVWFSGRLIQRHLKMLFSF